MAPNVNDAPSGTPFHRDDMSASGVQSYSDSLQSAGATETTAERNDRLPHACDPDYKPMTRIIWSRVAFFSFFHLAALYGLLLAFNSAKLATTAFGFVLYLGGSLGITAGAHRLWSHRAYKATVPLRVLLILLQTLATSYEALDWARNHRVHHKYAETDADPHNSNRGFFFAHIGWALCLKHPDITRKGKGIDLSDLLSDPILVFQQKHNIVLTVVCSFIVPTMIPMYLWNESFLNALFVAVFLRIVAVWNAQFLINSLAHMRGNRPFDRSIAARENLLVSAAILGEGWHNYHHTFPWDYKAAELGNYGFNLTTAFIDLMARIGWAYDLKTVPPAMVQARAQRKGDGTHEVWGWGDKDMAAEDFGMASIRSRKNKG